MEQAIIQDCMRNRRPLPQKIAEAPELYDGLLLFFQGFHELSSCRQLGESIGPIPWLAINQYCAYHGIVDEQREDFEWFISRLDAEYLTYARNKSKPKNPSPATKKPLPSRRR